LLRIPFVPGEESDAVESVVGRGEGLAALVLAQLTVLNRPAPERIHAIGADEDVALIVMLFDDEGGAGHGLPDAVAERVAEVVGVHLGRSVSGFEIDQTARGHRQVVAVFLGQPTYGAGERNAAILGWRAQTALAADRLRTESEKDRADAARARAASRTARALARTARRRRGGAFRNGDVRGQP
jgi:hypothetical protein